MNKDDFQINESSQFQFIQKLQEFSPTLQSDFDDFTFLAAEVCKTPMAFISIIEEKNLRILSGFGVAITIADVPFDLCICKHTVLHSDVLAISDVKNDYRLQNNPLIQDYADIGAYAGIPLFATSGKILGTLSVIDKIVRTFEPEQIFSLKVVARQVQKLIELNSQILNFKNVNERLSYKKAALENMSEGVSLVNEELKIIEFNSALKKILGLTSAELQGKSSIDPSWKTIKEDMSDFPRENHPSIVALKTGLPQKNIIMGLYKPNEQVVWLKINAQPVFLKNQKNASHVVISLNDITEEKNAHFELIKQKENFKRVLNCIPSMVGFWTSDLINISANKSYTNYFRKEPSQIEGLHIKDLLGEELYKKNEFYIKKVLNGEPQSFERDLQFKDGSIRHTIASYTPEFKNGKVTGFLVIVNDITEQKQLEAERRNMEIRLIESARLSTLGEMAAGIAHEINSPLAIIQGKSHLLRRKIELNELNQTYALEEIKKIEDTTLRISTIIKGLRSFSRDAHSDPFTQQSIHSIIVDTLGLCSEKFKHEDIHLVFTHSDHVEILCRPSEISQVLMNLLSNSYDSVRQLADKWIKIDVICFEENLKILVTDSGCGIEVEIAKKIMQPFFTTKEVGKGTGLGLSISKGIIESHHGRLYYDDKSKNTCFVIELPLAEKIKRTGVA